MNESWVWLLLLGLTAVGVAAFLASGDLDQPAILAPAPGAELGLPARVVLGNLPDGAEIGVRLLDSYGRPLGEGAARARGGRAELELYYDLPIGERGRLEVFTPLPGLEGKVLAAREVRFADVPYSWAKVYFLDPAGNPFPLIRRVPRTSTPARQAMELLLSGPTWRERLRGYWSALPEGARLADVSISGGLAEVRLTGIPDDFSSQLSALAAKQIELTLLEFPTISGVRVYADGEELSAPP